MTEDNRIREIRAVLAVYDGATSLPADYLADTIRAILDSAPPAPRVFFPGDTVPAGVPVLYRKPSGLKFHIGDEPWEPNFGPMWEITVPSPEEWQATVDQARRECANPDTEGTNSGE